MHAIAPMKPTIPAIALSLVMGLTVAACVHDTGPTPNPPQPAAGTGVPAGVTNAQNQADLGIADQLAAARCDRAVACNDIGDGHMYVSRTLCMDQVRGNLGNAVNSYTCPRGVDRGAVDRCLVAISEAECGKPSAVRDTPECKVEALCLR